MSLKRSLMPASTKQISGRAAITQVSSIQHLPGQIAAPARRSDVISPEPGFQSPAVGRQRISEQDDPPLRRFGQDAPDHLAARFDRTEAGKVLRREHPENCRTLAAEPGSPASSASLRRRCTPQSQVRRSDLPRVETGVAPARRSLSASLSRAMRSFRPGCSPDAGER